MALLGTPQIRIILTDAEIERIGRSISATVTQSSREIVERLAKVAVDYLRTLNERARHPYLAGRWTYAMGAVVGVDGGAAAAATATVYSEAEFETFQNTDAYGRPSNRWTIQGHDLLRILEGGARRHEIVPVNAQYLSFRAPPGYHKSTFAGAGRVRRSGFLGQTGVGVKDYLNSGRESQLRLEKVDHPGTKGNHFVAMTRKLIEERVAAEAYAVLSRLSLR